MSRHLRPLRAVATATALLLILLTFGVAPATASSRMPSEKQWRADVTQAMKGSRAYLSSLTPSPGEELVAFAFGSTVVLLIGGPKAGQWQPVRSEGGIKVGERLGMCK